MENRMTITRKQKWKEKQLYGRFKRLIYNISHEKTWTWLRKENFTRETESLPIAAQNNAIRPIMFIIKGCRTIVFIFMVISTFWPICPPAFYRCLSNSETYTQLRTMSFIESMEVAFLIPFNHNRVQVLGIPVFLLACCQD